PASRRISGALARGQEDKPGPTKEEQDAKVREAAGRQASTAMAALGSARLDQIEKPDRWARREAADWPEPSARQEARPAAHWGAAPGGGGAGGGGAPGPDGEKARGEGDGLCRQIPGVLVPASAPDPPADLRRLEAHTLFLALARRTLLDQWWSEDPKSPRPYYQ